MSLHPFEHAGLGKAPFHCTHVTDLWSACQFCGTPIRYQFHIAGHDGSHFYVGSDCVAKTGGHEHISNFREVRTKLVREQRAKKAAERAAERKAQWAAEAAVKRAAFDAEHPGLYDFLKAQGAKSNFCADMAHGIDKWGGLTARQLEVSLKIKADAEKGPMKLTGSLAGLAEMFRKAREHLKYPKLTVGVDGTSYTFSLAGDSGRNPGSIYVKSHGTYLGKVSPDGELVLSRDARDSDVLAINRFSANPAAVAGAHGHLHGNCCFCQKKLTDARSVEVGYGKVCAGHFNLPW